MHVRAIRIHHPGGPDALRFEDVALDEPGPGEVRVRHEAIGVNFIDTYHRKGLYPLPLPAILGSEACGVVEALGPEVTTVSVGDRVAYAGGTGAYCDARNIAASRVVKVPQLESTAVAASLLRGMTVEFLIHRTFAVTAGQTVLFHAAAGGVGLLACQWLRALGAITLGTVGTDEKARLAESYGCDQAIVYRRQDFVAEVRARTNGRGVPVVYDSVGRSTLAQSLDCLAPRGLLVSFGNASGKPDPIDVLTLSQKGSLFLTRPTLTAYTASREELELSSQRLFDVLARGLVRPVIADRLPLARAADAHALLESRTVTGALVLVP